MNQKNKQLPMLLWILALISTLTFLLTACGSEKDTAATMRLVRTDGTVRVDNAAGKSVKVTENLGLYNGYELTTRAESYGWITLDDSKLAKMDEESDVEIRKKKNLLELYVRSGSLFFNVTEPLAEDETMEIRTSTMAVGIRGTSGWVEVADTDLMCVYLLRGKVECTVYDRDGTVLAVETITAGQAAKMTRDGDNASITVATFPTDNTPDFVTEALNHPEHWPQDHRTDPDGDQPPLDDRLDIFGEADEDPNSGAAQGTDAENIPDDFATDAPAVSMTPEVAAALEQYRDIINHAHTYTYDNLANVADDTYRYALVQMQTEYTVPALLLIRDHKSNVDEHGLPISIGNAKKILLFQFNPDTKNVSKVPDTLTDSDSTGISMAGDGNGVLISSYTSSIGKSKTDRFYLDNNLYNLHIEPLWERNGFEDTTPDWTEEEIGHLTIRWYQTTNTEGLDYWEPYATSSSSTSETTGGETIGQEADATPEPDTDQWAAVASEALEQYRTIVSEADTYTFQYVQEGGDVTASYRYVLFQEDGQSVPTLVLRKDVLNRTGYLMFRYNPGTGTTSRTGSDYSSRFDEVSHKFLHEIDYSTWCDTTDTSGLDMWEP